MRTSACRTEDSNETKITIYTQSGHIVQKFHRGVKSVTIPKSAEISSIVVIGMDGNIIPFSYVPATNMGIALTNRSSGEKVDVDVMKNGEHYRGKILALGSDNISIISTNKIINIRDYDQIEIGILDDSTHPQIILDKDNIPFTLSYLVSSVSWNCIGTALIDSISDVMYLRLAGKISNMTENDIAANTTLISGTIQQNRFRSSDTLRFAPRASLMAAAPVSSERVETSMVEDYTKYEVGHRIIHEQDIVELGTWSFPVIKLYIHDTNDEDIVKFGYRIIAPGFIPSCLVNVYSIDSNKTIDSYLGSDTINESQKDNEVDIILGESTMLQCKSSLIINDMIVSDETTARQYNLPIMRYNQNSYSHGVEDPNPLINENIQVDSSNSPSTAKSLQTENYTTPPERFINKSDKDDEKRKQDDRQWHVIVEDLTVDITNHNLKSSMLLIKHFVGDKILVDTKCINYTRRKTGYLEWYFQIPHIQDNIPRKETFVCQIVTASYY